MVGILFCHLMVLLCYFAHVEIPLFYFHVRKIQKGNYGKWKIWFEYMHEIYRTFYIHIRTKYHTAISIKKYKYIYVVCTFKYENRYAWNDCQSNRNVCSIYKKYSHFSSVAQSRVQHWLWRINKFILHNVTERFKKKNV